MIRARAGLLLLALASCGDDVVPPPPEAKAKAPAEFRNDAHVAAYARLLPLARVAFDQGDPITAALLDGGPPAPLPFTTAARAVLRTSIDAAWAEAEDIDANALGLEKAALLRAIRFGLSRLRDDHVRNPSTRSDPGVGVRATARLLDDVARRGADCEGCDAALGQGALALQAALADVGASSLMAAKAATADCLVLRERLRAQAGDAAQKPGVQQLVTALGDASDRIDAMVRALEAAPAKAAPEHIAVAKDPAATLRLPDRMGATTLRRWLDVHESEARKADVLVGELARALVQLDALAKKDADANKDEPTVGESAVDAARCAAAWAPIATWAKTQPPLAAAALDCTLALPRLPARADDADLAIALVHLGVVEPTELAQRRRVEPLLARVGGSIAPASHRHALTIATLSGLGRTDARARVLAAATHDICLAMTALWVHGELGDDAKLGERLGAACASRKTEVWIADAVARPERALAGLGLSLLALGPADAVALEQFWWLPIGLVIPLARPTPTIETPVDIQTERLEPEAQP